MAKTKKELEFEVRILKAMYEAADEERMAYAHILEELALNCYHAAQHDIRELKDKEYYLSALVSGKIRNDLEKFINELIKERG